MYKAYHNILPNGCNNLFKTSISAASENRLQICICSQLNTFYVPQANSECFKRRVIYSGVVKRNALPHELNPINTIAFFKSASFKFWLTSVSVD